MSSRYRTLSVVLGAVCIVQLWRDCNRAPAEPWPAPECPKPRSVARPEPAMTGPADPPGRAAPASAEDVRDDGLAVYGFQVPGWAVWLAPHPGEDLRAYRDRLLPLALTAIAPQRARVARSRDSFAALASLDPRQRAELDAAAQDTAAALEDRVMTAVLGGELSPATFKPMTGVGVARDLLDIVGRGNRRFLDSLRDDQRAALAGHPFDFGDYLVFSTRWEDALKPL
jgi:hypothetical protein